MNDSISEYLTPEEAAALIDVHVNTIRNHEKYGNLPRTYKNGRVVLYHRDDVQAIKSESA